MFSGTPSDRKKVTVAPMAEVPTISLGGKSFPGLKDSYETSRDQASEGAKAMGRKLSKRPL